MRDKITITVTGAAGQVGTGVLPHLLSGEVFGEDTKVTLKLLDIPASMKKLEAVEMELEDCAFPHLEKVVITDNPRTAFEGTDWAVLIGARPRAKGMERGDLLCQNGAIFSEQGKILNDVASSDVLILVVGNPANTNCYITMKNAPDIPKNRFFALTTLDQNRAYSILARKAGVGVCDITKLIIWGNHGYTEYPDVEHALINKQPALEVIKDTYWMRNEFIEKVRNRGAEIINVKGASSGFSADKAIVDCIMSFEYKTEEGQWFSTAVPSDGSYGVDKDTVFSFPTVSYGEGKYEIVQGLELSDFSKEHIRITLEELREEKEIVKQCVPQ